MISRRELEGLIELVVGDLHSAERALQQRYGSLSQANGAERRAFLTSLSHLQQRASLAESLIAAMETSSVSLEPLAA
jgi:diphthamide synthase subunit DPH2